MHTSRLIRTSSFALVVALTVGVSACGGSSSKSTGDTSKSGTTTKGDGSSTGNRDLDALLSKAKSANVKVTYESSGSSDTFTVIQYHGDSGFISGDSEFLTTGSTSYSCSDLKGTPQCVDAGAAGANLGSTMTSAFFGVHSALFTASGSAHGLLGGVSKDTSSETIAGRDAKCVKLSASALGNSGSVTACIDAQTGVFLKGTTTANGSSAQSIEATRYAESTADDVKPPAEPTTIPT